MTNNDNAANRYSYVGEVHRLGLKNRKRIVLDSLPERWKELHKKGYIHIHDLDAYGLTNNCLTFDLLRDFPYEKFNNLSELNKIISTFNYLESLFMDIGNEQSGGMAIPNFDNDMATILTNMGVGLSDVNKEVISSCIYNLILCCCNNYTRGGETSYYVSLNIGLASTSYAKFIAESLIDNFEKMGDLVFKPNIIFKVKKGINRFKEDPNFYLLRKALRCTAKKMIPTYVLCDSTPNKNVDPEKLAIMGCRTRVVDDLYGEKTSIGRGNIDNISINLPRLALEVQRDNPNLMVSEKIEKFTQKWDEIAADTKEILLDRYNKICNRTSKDFPINKKHHLWVEDFDEVSNVFRHGTLSLGFIGLSEAFEILTGVRYYSNKNVYKSAITFVEHMRNYCDLLKSQYKLNFSLLATSGELISGRFIELDQKEFDYNKVFDKGFYTNSFHINVDSGLTAFEKIELEGKFHNYCNGGCITYVELGEAPLSNDEGLKEYIEKAIDSGVHYLGFNFPKDVCNKCGCSGVFDTCPICGNNSITRIRRVSGYLEILDGFTNGKKNEEKTRRKN